MSTCHQVAATTPAITDSPASQLCLPYYAPCFLAPCVYDLCVFVSMTPVSMTVSVTPAVLSPCANAYLTTCYNPCCPACPPASSLVAAVATESVADEWKCSLVACATTVAGCTARQAAQLLAHFRTRARKAVRVCWTQSTEWPTPWQGSGQVWTCPRHPPKD